MRGVTFHPTNQWLISVSDDKSIRVWDLKAGRCCRTLPDAHAHFITYAMSPLLPLTPIRCLDYNSKDSTLATAGIDDVIRIFPCR